MKKSKEKKNRKTNRKQKAVRFWKSIRFRKGSYHAGVTVAVLVIVVLANMLVSELPSGWLSRDISSEQLYTLGDVTKEVVNGIDQDVTITLVAESGQLDERIRQMAENYAALSDHIKVEEVDPVVHPSVLTAYDTTKDTVVVSCEATGKQRSIAFSDIIVYDAMSYYYYGQYVETEFDGEGQLTSALDYVTNENTKKLYTTVGHEESLLADVVTEALEKQNMELDEVNLLLDGGIPEGCDALILTGPQKDLADDELTMLTDYLNEGGNIYVILGTDASQTPNLSKLLSQCGIETTEGYVADRERFYQNNPYYVFPVLNRTHEITSGYSSDDLALLLYPFGLRLSQEAPENVTTGSFLTTSSSGGTLVTETESADGQYVLGASAVITSKEETEGHLVAVTSLTLIDSGIISQFSNVENLNLFMDSLTWFFDDVSSVSIEAKSLETTYNTVLGGGLWSSLYIFVIPAVMLIAGFVIWLHRRKA